MKEPLNKIEQFLKKIEIPFVRDGNFVIFKSVTKCICVITLVDDYWVYIFTQDLLPKPIPANPNFTPLFHQFLQLNDFTKLGRFFLNENNSLEFGMDCRLKEFNEDLFVEMIDILDFTLSEKFSATIAPYYESLLKS